MYYISDMIKVLAAVFAAYEVYKMLHAGAFIRLIENTRKLADEHAGLPAFMSDPFVRRILVIELLYIIFVMILIFTPYWYITIAIIAVSVFAFSMVAAERVGSTLILTIGSAICAMLLMIIVLEPLLF